MSVFFKRRRKAAERVNYVPYIQSSGTQYLDTEYYPTANTRVVIGVKLSTAYSAMRGIFGVRDTSASTSPTMFGVWNNGAQSIRSDYFGTNKSGNVGDLLAKLVIDKNKNVTTVGDVTITNTAASGQCTNSMFVFAINNAGQAKYFADMELEFYQIYENDVLVQDCWPCYDPEGVACVYDKVGKEYHYNAGTGEFVVGGESGGDEPQPETYVVTITGTGSTNMCYVEINGTVYTSATTLAVEAGTIIKCRAATTQYNVNAHIYANGDHVYGSDTKEIYTYDYTVTGNCAVAFSTTEGVAGKITVTTS